MKILAIETSCDDTAISIIKASGGKRRPDFNILSNIVSSQEKIHAKYGGVFPTMAKREHKRNLVPVLIKVLKETRLLKSKIPPKARLATGGKNQKSKIHIKYQKITEILKREPELLKMFISTIPNIKKPNIDVIAVTVGPGLEPCLWVGVNFARAIAYMWNLPIVPVNHIEGHIASNWLKPIRGISNSQFLISKQILKSKFQISKSLFPTICLVVSGGHTQLILMDGYGKYKILGETRDDAAGEAFDKVAKMLNLGYPGGPAIATEAAKFQVPSFKFQVNLPRPMIYSKNYDFSFSGLKTAVLYLIKSLRTSDIHILTPLIAKEFQQAVIDVLISKTIRAAKNYKVKTIMLAGGVAANKELRKQFSKKIKEEKSFKFQVPSFKLSTDNAAMIAVAGHFHTINKDIKTWKDIKADANLRLANWH